MSRSVWNDSTNSRKIKKKRERERAKAGLVILNSDMLEEGKNKDPERIL